MAGIREYRRDKQKKESTGKKNQEEKGREDYDKKLRAHKLKNYGIMAVMAVFVVVLIVVIAVINYVNSYSDYTVENSARRTDSGYAVYLSDESGYIKCSRDGAAAFSFGGTQKWNKTYEINSLEVDECGKYFAVAGIGGSDIYIFNRDGYVSSVNTALPIVKISVSEQGLVVAILEDKDADYINMYDKDGNKIYTIKTTAESDGIPTDISVSPDGKKLAVAFTSVKGLDLSTSVVFYNFDEVGQNENERIVGGFDSYNNQLVGEVQFLNGTTVVAAAENIISFYMVKEYPKLVKNIEITDKIEQIFYSDTNFAYVYIDEENNKRVLCVYDTAGEKIFAKEVSESYTSFCFTEDGIMMYGGTKFMLINKKGKELISDEFETEISRILQAGDNKEYVFITLDKLYKIKFK